MQPPRSPHPSGPPPAAPPPPPPPPPDMPAPAPAQPPLPGTAAALEAERAAAWEAYHQQQAWEQYYWQQQQGQAGAQYYPPDTGQHAYQQSQDPQAWQFYYSQSHMQQSGPGGPDCSPSPYSQPPPPRSSPRGAESRAAQPPKAPPPPRYHPQHAPQPLQGYPSQHQEAWGGSGMPNHAPAWAQGQRQAPWPLSDPPPPPPPSHSSHKPALRSAPPAPLPPASATPALPPSWYHPARRPPPAPLPGPGRLGNPLPLGLAPGGTVDGSGIFLPPGRATRPAKICVILRGLPGSGKSHLARMIRSIERAHRGSARILSLDDYFLQEVSVEEAGKGGMPQRATKLEYQYEADMEAVYMASHLEAVRKTVTEGLFPVMVVDAVNPRQAHLQAFWALAREKGFQTYVVEMPRCLDVAKCADRNVHGWTADGLEKLKEGWEPTPLHMARMVVEGLLGEKAIEEVEMGTEEEEAEKEGEGSGEGRHRGKEGGGDGGGRGVKAGMKRSRWEMEDEEEEGEGDKGTGVRKSEGGGGERAETRAERKVRWREVIDDLAVFDEREEVGCIHRESEHGMRGREGISVMQIRRRQVRRKEVKGKAGGKEGGKEGEDAQKQREAEVVSKRLSFLQRVHREQREFKEKKGLHDRVHPALGEDVCNATARMAGTERVHEALNANESSRGRSRWDDSDEEEEG
ncbi:hypothetical protein NSK_003269 [Nannochloropsis salina CCMP1776]|uniref:YLP motif-containing protein 1 n=1 Tax=Nannochloropsis salina CCMP1776 TaxID=1027361 RepID=A0A4D9D8F9_9STRA|nr:hypothetical protein NSK_003269 [Nannochloropsis salina CCMP1776]|eukprot:TFJ85765.1 hypothetical protein NSK_003269 [Nannochloropsis salina CCMP1776]